MADATAVRTIQSNPLLALTLVHRGGLVCAACNGVWICPQYKDMLYVCRGSVIGMTAKNLLCLLVDFISWELVDHFRWFPQTLVDCWSSVIVFSKM